jgi:hypothetical protein
MKKALLLPCLAISAWLSGCGSGDSDTKQPVFSGEQPSAPLQMPSANRETSKEAARALPEATSKLQLGKKVSK